MADPDIMLKGVIPAQNKRSLWIGIVILLLVAFVGLSFSFFGTTGPTTGAVVNEGKIVVEPAPTITSSLTPDGRYELLLAVLRLEKTGTTQKITFANLVSEVDGLVGQADNGIVSENWEQLSACFGKTCYSSFDYHSFELDIVEQLVGVQTVDEGIRGKVFNRKAKDLHLLIREVLILQSVARDDNVVAVSNSVAFINDGIVRLNEPDLSDRWNVLVECSYVCDEYNAFLQDLVLFKLGRL